MIICKTPLRISFVGGGTDFSEFFNFHQGKVISATINKYMYVCLKKSYKEIFLKYSQFEHVKHFRFIKHPIVRETLKYYNLNNVDIASFSDIPGGSGLGSSSAFTVSLISCIQKLININLNKIKICKLATLIEINKLKSNMGYQDQYSTCFGGFNKILFEKKNIKINKLNINKKDLLNFNNHLFLVDTNQRRNASEILLEQKNNTKKNTFQLKEILKLCDDFEYALEKRNYSDCGKILNENWKIKKSFSTKITNNRLNEIYELLIKSGVYGAKLLGAGGGGFFLCIAKPEEIRKINKKINKLKIIRFEFDNNGSKILNI
jgi:D-glycero-alpha-D-manno-heptose-7-phosphate kinase